MHAVLNTIPILIVCFLIVGQRLVPTIDRIDYHIGSRVAESGKLLFYSSKLTLGTRPALRLARFLCGTEAMVYMANILATVSQMISILA